jgi:hypothetical protein
MELELAPLNMYEYEFDESICFHSVDQDRLLEASFLTLSKKQIQYLESLLLNDINILSSILSVRYCQEVLTHNPSLFIAQVKIILDKKGQLMNGFLYIFFEAILLSHIGINMQLIEVTSQILCKRIETENDEISNFFIRYILKCKTEYQNCNPSEKSRKAKLLCLLLLSIHKSNPSLLPSIKFTIMDLFIENFKLKEAVELYGIFTEMATASDLL